MADPLKKHWLIDVYDMKIEDAENEKKVSDFISFIKREIFHGRCDYQIVPVLSNVENPRNNGISAAVNAQCGHFTFHTFSQRGVAFMDLFQEVPDQEAFRERNGQILKAFRETFYYTGGCSMCTGYNGEGFGEHVIFEYDYIPLNQAFHVIDEILVGIGMTPFGDKLVNARDTMDYDIVQMITESHIAFHANKAEDKVFIDVFSCKPFDRLKVKEILATYGVQQESIQVISRGIKMEDKQF